MRREEPLSLGKGLFLRAAVGLAAPTLWKEPAGAARPARRRWERMDFLGGGH